MTQVGRVYGEALYTLALEEGVSDVIRAELDLLDRCFRSEPSYGRLLSCRSIPKQERCRILDNSFRGKVHIFVLNFLKILTENGYMRYFSDCCGAYAEHYNRDSGILPVTACTAVPLSREQTQRLTTKLSRITGMQVKLLSRIDPSILGGIRLDMGGKRLDDTVSHRLNAIRNRLRSTVL